MTHLYIKGRLCDIVLTHEDKIEAAKSLSVNILEQIIFKKTNRGRKQLTD